MSKRIITGIFIGLVTAALTQSANSAPTPAPPPTFERWYVVNLQGHPAGYSVERETRSHGRITSTTDMRITIGRGKADLTVRMRSRFVETADGKPIRTTTTQMLAATQTTKEVQFTDKGLVVSTTDSGRTSKRTLPLPTGKWLTPATAIRYVANQLAAGAKTITYRSFDPSTSMKLIDVTINVMGRKDIEVFGKVTPATKVEVSTSMMPNIKNTEFIDAQGHTLRSSVSMGFLTMQLVAADKALALTKRQGPQLLDQTLIHPDQAVWQPRKLRKATWLLRMTQGKLPNLLVTPSQTVKRLDDRSAEVTINMDAPGSAPGSVPGGAPESKKTPALVNSSMVNGKDPRIIKLTAEALKGVAADAMAVRKAEVLRRFVHRYIKVKSLDVGMASASEVAQTRQGDCTEHAVLLAAMLRAARIPSRTITGLMYVQTSIVLIGSKTPDSSDSPGPPGVFGYHMWTQAWLNGRWVDLDATLPNETRFDATHIAISSSEMADGQWVNDLVTLAPIIGELKITRVPSPR